MTIRMLLAAIAALAAFAVHADNHVPLSDGEIRKVDKAAKKLTIKHGPLVNLDMPAMTMVFQVDDAALLEALKPGDKVKFRAEKAGGAYKVRKLERAQ